MLSKNDLPSRQNKPMPEENTEVLLSSVGLSVESLPSRRHAQTMDNMQRAKEQDPDRTALVQRLSKQTGYLPEFVDSNLEELKKQQDAPTNAELDEMQQYAPLTYSYLNDKDFAVLLQDEYRKMGFFERNFKMVVNAFTRAWKQDTLADLRIKQRQADLENNAYAQGFDDEIELLEREIADIAEPRGSLISGAPFYAAEFGAQMLLSQPDALGAALSGAALGAGGGAAAGSVVPGVGTAAGAAAGAKYGFKGGYVAGLAKYASDLEGGLAYGELRNLRDANGKPLPVEVAIDASKTVGLINAALETAGDLVFVGGVLKPAGKLAAKAGSRVMGKTVSSVLGKTLAKIPGADGLVKIIEQNPAAFEGLSLRRTFMEAAKMWALTTSSEVATEYAQNAVQLGTEEAAKAKSGQPFERRSVKEVLTQSAQDMDKVLVGAGTLGLLGFGGNFHRYFSEVRQAERVGELYKQLGEGVKDLKLTERAPEKTVAFLAEQTNGTPLENIYIPVTAVDRVAQENNLDPHEFLQSIGPDVAAQYEEAKATGGNIEVKTSLWAVQSQLISKLTGKPIYEAFENDVKASPDARTKNELQEEQDAINKTAEEADKMILEGSARQDELDQAKDAIRLIFDRAVPPANMAEEMWEQQKETDTDLLAKLFVVEAKKRGQDLAEFLEHVNLPTIQTQLDTAQQQAQKQAQDVYAKIKQSLEQNQQALDAAQNGGITPILDYLLKRGGVITEGTDWASETENWRRKESNIMGLVNNKSGLDLGAAATAVQEYLQQNGYGSLIPTGQQDAYTADVPDLIEAVNKEIANYVPMYKREKYNARLNEILNVSTGQFKTLYEQEFGEKLPERGTRALKKLHFFLLREAVKDGMTPSETVLKEHNINARALEDGSVLFQFDGEKSEIPTNLYQSGIDYKDGKADTNSASFKKWFAGSKVVDENGEPLVVYHGTNAEFDTFDKGKIKRGTGFWFSSNKKTSQYYGPIKEFYLNIKNPIDVNKNRKDFIYKAKKAMPELPNDVSDSFIIGEALSSEKFAEYLQNNGYDAITLGDSYVVFSPTQIKSVYNRGTFDPQNPNIYYQSGIDYKDGKADINSASFKKWFGASKVVDENGEPLVVYHGSPVSNINFFDFNKLGTNTLSIDSQGFFFSNKKEVAENYTFGKKILNEKDYEKENFNEQAQKIIRDVVFSINPAAAKNRWSRIFRRNANDEQKEKLQNLLQKAEESEKKAEQIREKGRTVYSVYLKIENPYIIDFNGKVYNDEEVYDAISLAKSNKHDGVIIKNIADGGSVYDGKGENDYIAFYPEQIKSVYNRGTFDPQNPNIYYQTAFHGSPHVFERLSTEAIGTGDGVQAHGWGLYFAQDKRGAISYRTIKNGGQIFYKGKDIQELYRSLEKKGEYEKAAVVEDFAYQMDFDALSKKYHGAKNLAWFKKEILPHIKQEGALLKVEIPENDVLLAESKEFAQQPPKVQEGIKQLAENEKMDFKALSSAGMDGRAIYQYIVGVLKSKGVQMAEKQASVLLNQYGIKGISYFSLVDGNCFVIFDDKAVEVLNRYYQQSARRARGMFNDLTNTITLTPFADATTLTHELAHYWLNERWKYMQSGLASQAYQRDFKPLADYLGIKEGQKDLTREQHEKFAKSFEAYLSEGEAPSADLGRLFARFRRWMLRVYKDVKQALGVELNDDIRRVFDRMLATEEEIAQMERERSYEPFTKVPGMTEEDVRRLARLREDAHNEAVTRIMKEQMEELRLEMQQKRDFVEQKEFERVEKELSGREEYVLANVVESHFSESDFAKNNKKSGGKLPTARELAGAFKDNSFTQNDRNMWTVIAESNGMDAVNMAERLSALEPLDLAVAKETQRRMDKYDLNKDMKNLRQAAAQALTNEKALEVVALERELFLNKKRSASVQRALESKEIAKKYAREWLSKKPARQAARYQLYFSAQKKAAAKAARALANKDYELAAELKMQELFNAACAAESIRISKSLNRGLEFLKFTQRKKGGLLKKQEHFLQVADLLMRLGFPRRDYDPSMKIESLAAWVKRYKERGFDGVQIPDWLLNDSRDLDWRKLPMGSLQQAIDAIKNIQHTANFEDRLFSMNRRQTITELAWEVSQHLNNTISKEERKKHEDQVEFDENEVKKGISEYLYSMTKLNTLLTKADGYKDFGFMYEIFERPTKEAADKESVRLRKFREDYQKLIDEYYTKEEVQDIFEVKKYHPELGNECTKERLLSMALNMGNETNRQRLFNNPPIGYNYLKGIDGKDNLWTQQSVESLLRKNLTAKDWEFVQGVWNLIDEPWSEVSQMHKRLTGFAPGKVEAMPFAIATADGKNIALRGGYYPIKYDWRGSRWAEREEYLSQPLYTEENQAWVASTKTGHTKARAKEVGSPLLFSINLVERHMTEVIHDLYFRPVVADLRRMLDNDVMRETLIKNLGRQGYNLLKAHLNMIATGGQETSGIGVINKTVEWLRRHMTVAVLAGKMSVLFENFANPWLFVKAIDGFEAKDALQGFALALSEYGPGSLVGAQRAKDLRKWVFEKSPLMKDKSENFDITMRQLKKTTIFGEDSKLLEFTNAAMVATDDFFAVPMWVTAYKKFNAQFLAQNKTEAQADKLAVERADMLINRVLGSGRKYDAAEIMRNKNAIVRTLNMFATFMNNEYNRWSRETGLFLKERDALRYAGFVGGRLLAWQLVSQMLAGKWPEDLDAESLLKWWFSGVVDNVSGMFVGLRDILPVMVDKVMGWPSFGYRPTPLSGAMEDLVLRPVQAVSAYAHGKRSGQDTAETLAKAASYAAPYPGQLNTWFFNAYDYVFNAMTPRVSDVYRRRPKKERS